MIILIMSMMINNSMADVTFDTAKASIMNLQPALTNVDATTITNSLLKHSKVYNLDWQLMAAIIAQESSFRIDPQGCLHIKRICDDLGISQINYATWGKFLDLNRIKLLTDVDYNIETMARILGSLKIKYNKESQWHTRYHSFTPSHRRIYGDFIYHKFLKINSYAKGYQDKTDKEEKNSVSKRSVLPTFKFFGH